MELHPSRSFVTSSFGATGSIWLHPRRSTSEKLIVENDPMKSRPYSEMQLAITAQGLFKSTTAESKMLAYMTLVNNQKQQPSNDRKLDVVLFTPPAALSTSSLKKSAMLKNLFPYYRPECPSMNYAFTNYHSLNFFTSSNVPENSALIYPNSASSANATYMSGCYLPDAAFAFDFYINPRYTTDSSDKHYTAGTIFHLSACYAISLISGSSRDGNGCPDGFRIMMQLSHSANIPPRYALTGAYPNDLIFTTGDNSLKRNHWHHVTIRWGGQYVNDGKLQMYVDEQLEFEREFTDTGSFKPRKLNANPSALFVGNFYEGYNSGKSKQSHYFATPNHIRQGVRELVKTNNTFEMPTFPRAILRHPLNAEVHELKIYRRTLTTDEMKSLGTNAPSSIDSSVLFYVPPFFVRESPTRRTYTDNKTFVFGGVLETPIYAPPMATTEQPFNVTMSFGMAGHDINLENFVRDFAPKRAGKNERYLWCGAYPLLLNLTSSRFGDRTNPWNPLDV